MIGASLTVRPFASLTSLVPKGCPRVLIGMDLAGDFGTSADGAPLLGRCDEIARDLCRELGWEEELDRERVKTEILRPLGQLLVTTTQTGGGLAAPANHTTDAVPPPERVAEASEGSPAVATQGAQDARVEAAADALVEQIGKGLEISGGEGHRTPTTSPPRQRLRRRRRPRRAQSPRTMRRRQMVHHRDGRKASLPRRRSCRWVGGTRRGLNACIACSVTPPHACCLHHA